MAMGMSYEEFWDGDVQMAVYYRKAWKLKQKHEDEVAWLTGLYVYNTLLSVYPVLNPMAGKNAKLRPYPELPVTWQEKQKEVQTNKNFNKMMEFMTRFNSKFKEGVKQ